MKFTIVKEPLPFLIIDDTYDKEEQIQIYKELDFLVDKLRGPDETGSAKNKKDGSKKNNTGIFLDNVYRDVRISNILTNNRKLYCEEVKNKLFECHYAYKLFENTNADSTLLSYYGDGGSYFSHTDTTAITIITWFYKTPKNFTGGGFKFTEYDIDVEVKNNRSVIFFSSYMHEVSKVSLIEPSVPASGRFTISNFLCIGQREK